ncbi:hypothetical protein BK010_09705 [Tenericutes bacterium MO-XQ]|nr:hypothetical protein BK010_09705 [Tenericutes bacterium MO-XQ]
MRIEFFKHETDFWNWLNQNYDSNEGLWIKFDKSKTSSTLSAYQALQTALCFGWIDGQIKSIDETYYMKYFKKRTSKSIWSTLNKKYANQLIKDKKMMPSGLLQIQKAKTDGRWEKSDKPPVDFNIEDFKFLLRSYPKAYETYLNFSASIQKTYALSYYTLKKPESRIRRLETIIQRLESGLKPM